MNLFKMLKLIGAFSALMGSSLALAADATTTTTTTNTQQPQPMQGTGTAGMTTTTQITTDKEITQKVDEILSKNNMALKATVSDGVVNFSGTLSDASKLKDVVEATKGLPGVKEVKLDEVKAAIPEAKKTEKTK